MPTDAGDGYSFRRVVRDDLPMLARWLAEPHVSKWWGDPAEQAELIEGDLDVGTMSLWIVSLGDNPFAYVQSWDPHAYGAFLDQPPGTRGVDPFIGPVDMTGAGHGPRFLAAFARRLVAAGATRVIIDPDPENAAAVRAYAKAGFRPIEERVLDDGVVLLMAWEPGEAETFDAGA